MEFVLLATPNVLKVRIASSGVALEMVVFLMRPCACATQAYVQRG
jgi:hypothetical protein